MSIGFWQIMAIVVVLILLFGRGKISELMADTAKGIKSFKKGLAEDEVADTTKSDPKVIEGAAQKSEEGSKVS
ncbi:MAG: twin-arginine translocase TatA/TatE family subunit [Pseudomonadota bacterium]